MQEEAEEEEKEEEMKNPDSKPLEIVFDDINFVPFQDRSEKDHIERAIPAIIAIMECNARLVRAGKSSAMPHFIACVKFLEEFYGFRFELHEDKSDNNV